MSCNAGIHYAINKILGNKPWYKYKEGDKYIGILDTPSKKINKYKSIGIANDVARFINKEVNRHYPGIGDVVYPEFYEGRGIVNIAPTNKQLDLINSTDELEKKEILKQIEQESLEKDIQFQNKESNVTIIDGEIITPDDLPTIELTC